MLLLLISSKSDLTIFTQSEANKENSSEMKHAINLQANWQASDSANDLLESLIKSAWVNYGQQNWEWPLALKKRVILEYFCNHFPIRFLLF